MKTLIFAAFLAFTTQASYAASLTLPADESAKVVEALLLANVRANKAKPVYTLGLTDLDCSANSVSHAGSPDDVMWGFDVHKCAKPAATGATAKLIYETFDNLQTKYGSLSITDCAMGKCMVSLKSVHCSIDTRETETEKRFSCTLVDTQ